MRGGAAAGKFFTQGKVAVGREWLTGTRLPDGRVLLAGGDYYTNTESPLVAGVEIYDPATGQSAVVGSLAVPRLLHHAFALKDGHVLLAGGSGDGPAMEVAPNLVAHF